MAWKYLNKNPLGKHTGDCVVRAISTAMNRSWGEVYMDLAELGYERAENNDSYGSYGNGRRPYNDSSYARGRGTYAKRDRMGRYSSRDSRSYDDGMMDELHELMENAPDERTKQKLKRFIEEMN